LHSFLGPLPDMASALSCSIRGTAILDIWFPRGTKADLDYQQIMYGLVAEIANWWPEGPERRRFQAAADRFRLPYWDWATPALPGQSVFPLSVGGNAYISVSGPNGMQSISNPLYNYNFRPLNATAMLRAPVSNEPQLRTPISKR